MNKFKILILMILSFVYTNVKSENYYPSLNDFLERLYLSTAGDTIFFPDTIMDIYEPVTFIVEKGVCIKSNTGVIRYHHFSKESDYVPLFLMKSNSSLIGLTFIGANGEVDRAELTGYYQNAIKTDGENIQILNCDFYDFDKWAIWGYDPSGLIVKDCRFENIRREGYGYGVWIGGKGGVWPKMATIDNNVFINCRSAVDGSGGYYSMTVSNNIFGEQQTYSTVARHGQARGDIGGIHTWILGNIVLNPVNRNLEIPYPAVDTGYVIVERNMFTRVNGCWIGDTTMEAAPLKNKNVKVQFNSYTPIYDILSFSLKDNYIYYKPNTVFVRVLVNSRLIKEIDLAGENTNWKKYYFNISSFLVSGNNSINIEFVVKEPINPKIYIDDIQLNRISAGNTSFENSMNSWRLTPNGFGSRYVTEEFYDKIYSLRLQAPNKISQAILTYNFKR